jgi:ubiquinone/menaquinone biosynthesis C-methylase UbiE
MGHFRQLIKRLHPEGIPWPGSVLYNAISRTDIFLEHYGLVARDVARYGPATRILDIGTGPGQLLFALRREIPASDLVGIDISPAMVAQAGRNISKSGHHSRISVQAASADALPFADESFHRVVSTGSLHHWKNPIRALSEAHRVLKADGHALIYDLVTEMPKPIREEVRTRFGSFHLALLWLHSFEEPFLDAREMADLGRRTDFVVEETRFTGVLCCLALKKTGRR